MCVSYCHVASGCDVMSGSRDVWGRRLGVSVYLDWCERVQMVTRTKKMFVGGLSASTTIDDVKAYFESYGKVRATPLESLIL